MIAGVVIDSWKVEIFKRHLDAASYEYTEHPGQSGETVILKVKCEFVHQLQPIIEAAQKECAKSRAI